MSETEADCGFHPYGKAKGENIINHDGTFRLPTASNAAAAEKEPADEPIEETPVKAPKPKR